MKLVVNHPWFGFICKSSLRFYCTVSVTTLPRITLRGTGSSLETLSTLPRPIRPIFSKISRKFISISSCVIFQLLQKAMVSLKKQYFSDPTAKKGYMMHGATIFSFNQKRLSQMDFARSLGLGTDVHRGKILEYRCAWVLQISFVLTHFSLVCISGYVETVSQPYIPSDNMRNLHYFAMQSLIVETSRLQFLPFLE